MHQCLLTGEWHEHTHAHHIKTRGAGGTNETDNLIRVCPIHHDQIHRGYLVLDDCRTPRQIATWTIEGANAVRAHLKELVLEEPAWKEALRQFSLPEDGEYYAK